MASKRPIKNVRVTEQEDDPEESWTTWFLSTYAQYWYALLCLFIDSVVGLQIYQEIDGVTGLVSTIIVLIALVAVEVVLYRYLWGEEGRWATQDDWT